MAAVKSGVQSVARPDDWSDSSTVAGFAQRPCLLGSPGQPDAITLTRPFDVEEASSNRNMADEPETVPHGHPVKAPAEDHTSATLRRSTCSLEGLPFSVLPPPPVTVPGDVLQLIGQEPESVVTPVVHTGTLPWVAHLPKVDSTPPPPTAIPTPLTMITEREDNLTRVAPLAPRPQLGPISYAPVPSQPAPAASTAPPRRIALGMTAIALAAMLGFVAVRPHVSAASVAAGARGSERSAVVAPEPLPPPVKPPPVGASTLTSAPASASAPATRAEARTEPRRSPAVRRPPARPARPTSSFTIPVRREQ
ncbi:MAG: hypothetical protein K0S65_1138 [Labilithrix sp.]|nr:hypothetical protein [Labilithrix sp.]